MRNKSRTCSPLRTWLPETGRAPRKQVGMPATPRAGGERTPSQHEFPWLVFLSFSSFFLFLSLCCLSIYFLILTLHHSLLVYYLSFAIILAFPLHAFPHMIFLVPLYSPSYSLYPFHSRYFKFLSSPLYPAQQRGRELNILIHSDLPFASRPAFIHHKAAPT